jgi:hypothetical protein
MPLQELQANTSQATDSEDILLRFVWSVCDYDLLAIFKDVYAYTFFTAHQYANQDQKRICIYANITNSAGTRQNVYEYTLFSATQPGAPAHYPICNYAVKATSWGTLRNVYTYTLFTASQLADPAQERICIYVFPPPDPNINSLSNDKAPIRSGLCRLRAFKNHPPPTDLKHIQPDKTRPLAGFCRFRAIKNFGAP